MQKPPPGNDDGYCAGNSVGAAAQRIGNRHDHRLFGQVQPGAGIEGVEVRPDHDLHGCRRVFGDIGERIHWCADAAAGLGDISQLLPRKIHCDQRVEVQVSRHADRMCVLRADRLGRARRVPLAEPFIPASGAGEDAANPLVPRQRRAVRGKSCDRERKEIGPLFSSWPGLSRGPSAHGLVPWASTPETRTWMCGTSPRKTTSDRFLRAHLPARIKRWTPSGPSSRSRAP